MARLPTRVRWLFWEMDFGRLDTRRHADYIIGRVVEFGRLEDVRWLIKTYGLERIHQFFRVAGDTEISLRTIAFWRAYFKAWDETWAAPPSWRRRFSEFWLG